jgi:hypothetical protein
MQLNRGFSVLVLAQILGASPAHSLVQAEGTAEAASACSSGPEPGRLACLQVLLEQVAPLGAWAAWGQVALRKGAAEAQDDGGQRQQRSVLHGAAPARGEGCAAGGLPRRGSSAATLEQRLVHRLISRF